MGSTHQLRRNSSSAKAEDLGDLAVALLGETRVSLGESSGALDEQVPGLRAEVHVRRHGAARGGWGSIPPIVRFDARRLAAAFQSVAYFERAPLSDIALVASCIEHLRRIGLAGADRPRWGTMPSLSATAQAFYYAFLTVWLGRLGVAASTPEFFERVVSELLSEFRVELAVSEPIPRQIKPPSQQAVATAIYEMRAAWPRITVDKPKKSQLSIYSAAVRVARAFDIHFPRRESDARASRETSRATPSNPTKSTTRTRRKPA